MRRLARRRGVCRNTFWGACRIARKLGESYTGTLQALHVTQLARYGRERIGRRSPALPLSAPKPNKKSDLRANSGEAWD
jgi:hypothetical protein